MPNAMNSVILVAAAFGLQAASAQSLPPPSRTVFKCDSDGKTYYSDSPCLGAKRIDVEPTRGLNKTTGGEKVGRDVSREIQREQIATAVKPIIGLDPKGFEVFGRRQKLNTDSQRRCQSLDMALPNLERQEAQAPSSARHQLQAEFLNMRAEYRRLGC